MEYTYGQYSWPMQAAPGVVRPIPLMTRCSLSLYMTSWHALCGSAEAHAQWSSDSTSMVALWPEDPSSWESFSEARSLPRNRPHGTCTVLQKRLSLVKKRAGINVRQAKGLCGV